MTAILVVPFNGDEKYLIARFDPQTGMLRFLEAMRYKNPSSEAKTLWITEAIEWKILNGATTLSIGTLTWLDEGTPWAVFSVKDVVYNVEVQHYIRAKGPYREDFWGPRELRRKPAMSPAAI